MIDRIGQVWVFGWHGEETYISSYIIVDNRIAGNIVLHLCWFEGAGPETGTTWIEEDWFSNEDHSKSARMERVL